MKSVILLTFTIILGLTFHTSLAHEIRPAYLQITEVESNTYRVLWKVPRTVDKVINISPEFENDFELIKTDEPRMLEAFMLYSFSLEGRKSLENTSLTVTNLTGTTIDVLVDIRLLNGDHYTFLIQPNANTITIPQQPGFWEVAKTYTVLGIEHILFGFDHLLFVLALMMIATGIKKLIKTITAFTIAHSITLSFSVLGIATLPGPPVEAVIALSIVFLAIEILKTWEGKPTLTSKKPWLVAFTFGLLHGFGFAGALADIGLPQSDIPLALATFNIGVETGQIIFVLTLFFLWHAVIKHVNLLQWQRKSVPYAIGAISAYWLIERVIGF